MENKQKLQKVGLYGCFPPSPHPPPENRSEVDARAGPRLAPNRRPERYRPPEVNGDADTRFNGTPLGVYARGRNSFTAKTIVVNTTLEVVELITGASGISIQ